MEGVEEGRGRGRGGKEEGRMKGRIVKEKGIRDRVGEGRAKRG